MRILDGRMLRVRSGAVTVLAAVAAAAGWVGTALLFYSGGGSWTPGGVTAVPNLVIAAALLFFPLIGRWPLPAWRVLLAALIWFVPVIPLAYIVTVVPTYTGVVLFLVTLVLLAVLRPSDEMLAPPPLST